MNTKTLSILALLAVAAVIAAAVALRSDKTASETPMAAAPVSLFPDLSAKVNDVAAVSVKTATGESTVELADGKWRLKEKSGYPVDSAKVRELLLSLAALKNIEAKTSRPEGYKTLGVEDIAKKPEAPAATPANPSDPPPETSRSVLLALNDKSGQTVASVIVGNIKYPNSGGIPGGGGGAQGIYLRKPGDTQSYLAEGKLDVPREPLNWVNSEFVDIARDRIRSVTLTPRENADTDRIVVSREKPGEGAFVVQAIPAGKQLKDTSLSESVAAGLVKTTFEDVAKVDSIDFAGATTGATLAEVRTWDGLIVKVDAVKVGEKSWWKLTPMADPEPFLETPPAPPPAAPAADGTPAPAPPAPGDPKPKRTPEEVKKEVDELAARWSGWAYSPLSYKATAFAKKLSEELKDPVPPPAPPAPASPQAQPMPAPTPSP